MWTISVFLLDPLSSQTASNSCFFVNTDWHWSPAAASELLARRDTSLPHRQLVGFQVKHAIVKTARFMAPSTATPGSAALTLHDRPGHLDDLQTVAPLAQSNAAGCLDTLHEFLGLNGLTT